MSKQYKHVALIGLGLIASSISHAMRRANMDARITGYARSAATRGKARELGLCDKVYDSATDAVRGADLVILAVPVGAMGAVSAEIAPFLKAGAVVTDVGSVKRAVIEAVAPNMTCPRACILYPATHWPERKNLDPMPVLPAFLTTVGVCLRRMPQPTKPLLQVCVRSGRPLGPTLTRWNPITTIWC